MRKNEKKILIALTILVVLLVFGWLVLKVKPKPFKPLAEIQPELKTMEIPGGLPKPVETFYRTIYGEKAPLSDSVVIIGHGRVR